MRIFFVLVWMSGLGLPAAAQDVGLGDAAIMKLKDSLTLTGMDRGVTGMDRGGTGMDQSLTRRYNEWKRVADQALGEDPHPVDTIRSEGLLQGDPQKAATQQALRDM